MVRRAVIVARSLRKMEMENGRTNERRTNAISEWNGISSADEENVKKKSLHKIYFVILSTESFSDAAAAATLELIEWNAITHKLKCSQRYESDDRNS
jgi:hypothetical protein